MKKFADTRVKNVLCVGWRGGKGGPGGRRYSWELRGSEYGAIFGISGKFPKWTSMHTHPFAKVGSGDYDFYHF